MVINTETLLVENVLDDKSYLAPLGFDAAGRFWLQRDNSTPTIKTLARIGASLDCSTAYLKSLQNGVYDRQAGGEADGRA